MASADNALSKFDDLRKAVLRSNPTPNDINDLADWERSIKKIKMAKAWVENAVTKEVYGKIMRQLVDISTRLSTEGNMPEDERRRIFEVKKAYLWLLSLHHANAGDDAVLEQIEEEIERATKEYGEFSSGALSNLPHHFHEQPD